MEGIIKGSRAPRLFCTRYATNNGYFPYEVLLIPEMLTLLTRCRKGIDQGPLWRLMRFALLNNRRFMGTDGFSVAFIIK